MADDQTAAGAQEATAATVQATASTTEKQPQAGTATTQADDALSLDTKKKLDKENLQLRRERDAALAKIQEFEAAKLSEVERLQKQVKDLTDQSAEWAAERRERDARDAVYEAAASEKVGARNPRALYKLIRDDLEFDEKTGRLTNLDQVLKQAKTEYPEQFGRAVGSADGGAGSRARGAAPDMNSWLRG